MRTRKYLISGFILAATLSLLALALSAQAKEGGLSDTAERKAQRLRFELAEKALAQGKRTHYRNLKASLKDYPLYPYLQFEELQRDLGSTNAATQVREFLAEHEDTPLADRLHRSWLDKLAKRKNWHTYLDFYRPTTSTVRRCNNLQALIQTGKQALAFPQIESLWLSGRSQPEECDPVFGVWHSAGHLTPERVWARIGLAMSRGQLRLARYLERFLDEQDQTWLNLWLKVHHDPGSNLSSARFQKRHPMRNTILLHGVTRLARKEPAAATTLWRKLVTRHNFSLKDQIEAERALALALIGESDADNLDFLHRIEPCENDKRLQEARIRAALSRRDWNTALAWLEALPEENRKNERWLYWRARALAELGYDAESKAIFQRVAKERSYYGFLASDRLGVAYSFDNNPLAVDIDALDQLAKQPAAQRAYELRALGRLTEARREWEWMAQSMDSRQLALAAKLAQNWGWHDRAIFTIARSGYWDDLELRFPLEYRQWIEREAKNRKLDSAWIFAVVRQESAFSIDARSSAGALGLMQLMPRTARKMARKLGNRALGKTDLIRPAVNIRVGTAYLRKVLDAFGKHPVLATAAYNAGPRRVRAWLPAESMPADLWVEAIPFEETRTYVRRVLAYTVIYEQRLGREPNALFQRMRPVGKKIMAKRKTGRQVSPKS